MAKTLKIDPAVLQAMITFVLTGITVLRDTSKGYGIHSKFTGFLGAFQTEFGVRLYEVEYDAKGEFVAVHGPMVAMAATGKIAFRAVGGGYMLYNGTERAAAVEAAAGKREAAAADKSRALASKIRAAAGK